MLLSRQQGRVCLSSFCYKKMTYIIFGKSEVLELCFKTTKGVENTPPPFPSPNSVTRDERLKIRLVVTISTVLECNLS